MIYYLLIVFSYFIMASPMEKVALTTSQIYLIVNLIDITNIDKIFDLVGQKSKFLCNRIGCEVQEGAE